MSDDQRSRMAETIREQMEDTNLSDEHRDFLASQYESLTGEKADTGTQKTGSGITHDQAIDLLIEINKDLVRKGDLGTAFNSVEEVESYAEKIRAGGREADQARQEMAERIKSNRELRGNLSPTDRHIQALIDQANTAGTSKERESALAGLRMHGFKIDILTEEQARAIYAASGGDSKDFYYDLTGSLAGPDQGEIAKQAQRQAAIDAMSSYKTIPPNVLTEEQARAIYAATGGDTKKFYYKPEVYHTLAAVRDLELGLAPEGLSPETFDLAFGEGSYQKTLEDLTGNYQVDPVTNTIYPNKFLFGSPPKYNKDGELKEGTGWGPGVYLDEFGTPTGELDWKRIHQEFAAAEVWQMLKDRDIKSSSDGGTSDKQILALAEKYGHSQGAIDGIHQALAEYREMPGQAKQILQGKDNFEGKTGFEGVNAWADDQTKKAENAQFKYEAAQRVIGPAMHADGSLDLTKVAAMIHGDDQNAKNVLNQLINLGYTGKDAAGIVRDAEKISKYEYDLDTFGEHGLKESHKMGERVAKGIETFGESQAQFWGDVAEKVPGLPTGTPEAIRMEAKGMAEGLATFIALPPILANTLVEMTSGYAAGEGRAATDILGGLVPISYDFGRDKWVGFGPEVIKSSIAEPWEEIPKNLILFAPMIVGGVRAAPKVAQKIQSKISPWRADWNNTLAIELNLPSDVIPKEMSELAARQLVEHGELKSLGLPTEIGEILESSMKANDVPTGLWGVVKRAYAEAARTGRDFVLKDAEGKIWLRVSPINRTNPMTLYTVTSDIGFVESAAKAGTNVKWKGSPHEGGDVVFTSPQAPSNFVVRYSGENPGVSAIKITLDDIAPHPKAVQNMPTLDAMRAKMIDMMRNNDPALIPGKWYPVFKKWHSPDGPRIELEFIGYKMETVLMKPKWYSAIKTKSVPTLMDWKAIGKKVKSKEHIVFDLDNTLIDSAGNLLPGAKEFLMQLKKDGKKMSLWTHSDKARAIEILKEKGIC